MRISTFFIVVFALVAQVAIAAENPLDMIPASASVIVRLQAPETMIEELGSFIDKVQPGFGNVAKAQLMPALGQAISNTSLDGVDITRDWYVAIFIDEDKEPKSVLLIPTTDVAEVKEAMGSAFEFIEKNGWLVCTNVDQYHDEFKKCLSGEADSVSKKFDERTKAALMSGHLCAAVNVGAVRQAFEEELSSAEGRLEDLIQAMGQQIKAASPETDMGYVLDMYRDMGKLVLQGAQDSNSAVISIRVTNKALQIDQLLTVDENSKTDAFFRTQPVGDMARLGSIPEGLPGYAAVHADPAIMLDWSERVMSSMFKDKEQKEKATQSLAIMRKAKFGTIAGGGDLLPDEDAALRYFAMSEISPSSVVLDAFKAMGSGMEYEIAGIVQKQSFEMNAEKIDGQSVNVFRMQQTMPPSLDPTGMQKAINEKMYGPDGIVQRIVVKDDVALQTMGGGTDSMKQLMTAKNWSDPLLLEARARQHEKANLIMLVDVPNMVQKFATLILGLGVIPFPIQPEQLDGLEIAPSYSGFSLAVEKQRATARTCVPVETFQGFVQIGIFVQQLRGQLQ